MALCLVAQCVLAQYGQQQQQHYQPQQRKLAPTPQTAAAYPPRPQMTYEPTRELQHQSSYGVPQETSYSQPASAPSYSQRSSGYGKQSSHQPSYGNTNQAASYQQTSYSAKPKYEEPYVSSAVGQWE